MDPQCRSQTLVCNAPTGRAVVLLHGLTACPQQMVSLGRRLLAAGYHVVIPCMPFHGLRHKHTSALRCLTEDSLRQCALEAVSRAHQMAEQVQVIGFSMGGVLAAWLAMECQDVERVVMAAPAFGMAGLTAAAHPAALSLMSWFPNLYIWWDPLRRDYSRAVNACGYPGFPLQALHTVVKMGFTIYQQAYHQAPRARQTLFILNQVDRAVNNAMAHQVAARWNKIRASSSDTLSLPYQLRLGHDYFYNQSEQASSVYEWVCKWVSKEIHCL